MSAPAKRAGYIYEQFALRTQSLSVPLAAGVRRCTCRRTPRVRRWDATVGFDAEEVVEVEVAYVYVIMCAANRSISRQNLDFSKRK